METSSYIALSRQSGLRRQMDVVANNLANMNTTAFKSEKMMFVEHLVKSRSSESFIPIKLAFSRDIAQFRDMREGPIKTTGNPLDLAVRKDGFFVIETPGGERYTRNGRFRLDQEGQVVTQSGFPVLSSAGTPLFLSPEDKDITVATDGTFSTNNGDLGKLRIVRFNDPQRLQRLADGLYSAKKPDGVSGADLQPEDVEGPSIIQGALEGSNVQPIIELTRMIEVNRAYDSVKKFIDKEDDRQKKMIQQLAPRF